MDAAVEEQTVLAPAPNTHALVQPDHVPAATPHALQPPAHAPHDPALALDQPDHAPAQHDAILDQGHAQQEPKRKQKMKRRSTADFVDVNTPNHSNEPEHFDPKLVPSRATHEPKAPSTRKQPIIDRDAKCINTPIVSWENDDAVYWYSIQTRNYESMLIVVETSHYDQVKTVVGPGIPKTFWRAMKEPPWAKAIDTELTKFEVNSCLRIVSFTGQHLVPMMWLFSVKNDVTKNARLVGRGNKTIPNVDFDPETVYCGNVSACSIKLALLIAAVYELKIRGGDLVGAYLITRANIDFPVYIVTPQGYDIPEGYCIQAIGNLYGYPLQVKTFQLNSTSASQSADTKTPHGT